MTPINNPHERTLCESGNGTPAAASGGAELAAVEDADGGECGTEPGPALSEGARPVELLQLLAMELPLRKWLHEGPLQERDRAMVHASRGIGKSRLVHSVAVAVDAGVSFFLRYPAPETQGVVDAAILGSHGTDTAESS
jgi:hypothetical protein